MDVLVYASHKWAGIEVGLGGVKPFENIIGLSDRDKGLGSAIMFFDISEEDFLESFDAGRDAAGVVRPCA